MTTYPVGWLPPGAPTVSGTLVTIDAFLRQPLQVQRVLQDLTYQRFIADRIFAPGGTATGGAVLYDQILANDLYPTRDVQPITPGSEFPILTDAAYAPLTAKTTKWGGAIEITYEARDRDRRDLLNRELTKLRNAIVRKVDTVALAVVKAAPINTGAASATWATATTKIPNDVATVQAAIDALDMGYVLTDAYVSPTTMNNMVNNTTVQNALANPNLAGQIDQPILQAPNAPRLRGFLGLNWWVTNRVLNNEVLFFSGNMAGAISDEKPLYSRVIDQPEYERVLVQAARLTVPYVTDPKSVYQLTGV